MRVVVCAIAKNENKYINEWAHHYFNLGFDHIYLYDNNFSKDPYVGDCFDDDIKDKITIFDVRDICGESIQERSYNNFYSLYGETFDWCLFCDIDEFLTGVSDINNFFIKNESVFKPFKQVRVKWKLFGDDDIIERDESIPVFKFFKKPIEDNIVFSNQAKMFIKGHLDSSSFFIYIHYALANNSLTFDSCLPSGKKSNIQGISKKNGIILDYKDETIFLNHYRTKTLKEFLNQKFGRTDCDRCSFSTINLSYFFAMNKNTPEKQEYIKKWLQQKIEERRK